jgi:hypothetical protein
MAPIPFRRRGKLSTAAQNLALAEAAMAIARGRPGRRGGRRRGRTLLLGGVAAAVAAGALLKRDKVAGLLPSRAGGDSDTGYQPPASGPSNYDAPGPVANTATPVPAPEPHRPEAVDEQAEEAAAAAEAANIGGQVSDYAGPAGQPASEAERPLAEAGEGESEGQEQAELGLERAAEPTAPGVSDAERQIENTIEAAENPAVGETVEPTGPGEEATPADEAGDDKPNEGGSDWRTWSGRSVNP